jgi:hypothetical protein
MASLRWQSAADYCRALNPDAHLLVIDSQGKLASLSEAYQGVPPHVAASCPYWWTAGQRVDESTINSPFVWRTFGKSCPAGGCLSELNFPASWDAGQGSGVPEGQPTCVMIDGNRRGVPWVLAPCSTHACALCEVTPSET